MLTFLKLSLIFFLAFDFYHNPLWELEKNAIAQIMRDHRDKGVWPEGCPIKAVHSGSRDCFLVTTHSSQTHKSCAFRRLEGGTTCRPIIRQQDAFTTLPPVRLGDTEGDSTVTSIKWRLLMGRWDPWDLFRLLPMTWIQSTFTAIPTTILCLILCQVFACILVYTPSISFELSNLIQTCIK